MKSWDFHFKCSHTNCGNMYCDNIYEFTIVCGNHSFLMDSIQYRSELLVFDALVLFQCFRSQNIYECV